MTNSTFSRSLIAAAFVSTMMGLSFASGEANASITSQLQHCASNSKSKTIDCCQAIVGGSAPLWMKQAGRNCASAVSCATKSSSPNNAVFAAAPRKVRVCYVVMHFDNGGGSNEQEIPQREVSRYNQLR